MNLEKKYMGKLRYREGKREIQFYYNLKIKKNNFQIQF